MHLPEKFDELDEVLDNKPQYIYSVEDYKILYKHLKYIPRIVVILYNSHNSMTPTELAFSLGLKKKHLGNIIRKLAPFEILYDEYIMGEWFCGLTAKGCEFYKYLKNNNLLEVK